MTHPPKFQPQRKQKKAGRVLLDSARRAIPFALLILVFVLVPFAIRYLAFAQQQSAPALDVQASSRDTLVHLDGIIQFYRATAQPIQKIGEPNDAVYRDQAVSQSGEIAGFAFAAGKAEALFLASSHTANAPTDDSVSSEHQRIQTTVQRVEKRITDLESQQADIEKKLATASPRNASVLEEQKKQITGELELSKAMKDALEKIANTSGSAGDTGLAAEVDQLQRSVPELNSKNKTPPPQLTPLDTARSAGVTSQAIAVFDLLNSRQQLDSLMAQDENLHKQAVALRAPLTGLLRGIIQQSQQVTQQAPAASPASSTAPTAAPAASPAQTSSATPPANIEAITKQFKSLSAAAVPLSQEIIVLEEARANLAAWRASVDREYKTVLHSILLRICVMAIALAMIIIGGEIWTRATNKYIRDTRRRRQFLVVRRVVVSLLAILVVVFGFVTQFESLATFAGFITAGIAVGLQTILLSVAAYFFIIGRYGIRVGDRITVASVTGDVIDVGLVRFYVMELAGSGTALNPTGRVAVFSNAVLFQAGTPLYKQIPGTEYAWHEVIIKLNEASDFQTVSKAVVKELDTIYAAYKSQIDQQHDAIQNWMETSIEAPALESRLQFSGGAFEFWARIPVLIKHAADTDEKITQALVALVANDPEIKSALAGTPVIQASVRG
jgi:small-conductance mechanosensitive channel